MATDIKKSEDLVSRALSIEVGDATKLSDETPGDIGWNLYQAALRMDPAEREAIAKRVKLKLDLILLPLVRDQKHTQDVVMLY